ncbi:MAG: hypothetical protein KJ066_23825 [Acidobacteria bacterium]|nr:hypothetical protein [Acidobacteriota bacterium]
MNAWRARSLAVMVMFVVAGTLGRGAAAQSAAPPPPIGADDRSPAGVAGTETNPGPGVPFLEGTDVFWTVRAADDDRWFPYKLEADIFPHLVVAQNFDAIVDLDEIARRRQDATRGPKEFAYAISGTPAVRIRMLREVSAPVRTPSYMPRVNFQVLWARNFKAEMESQVDAALKRRAKALEAPRGEAAGAEARRQDPVDALRDALAALPSVSLWEAHVIVGHHSNGQDGCTSGEQTREPDTERCLPEGVVPRRETVNRRDGSFSTNYVRTGINYSRNWMSGEADLQAEREARARVEFEWHPRGAVDEDIVDIYGRARLLLGGAYAKREAGFCRKRLEGSAGLVWNPGVAEGVPETSWTLQVSCFPTPNGGWGLFARFYTGQDYYNIAFLDGITRLHVGATFNQGEFFRFRRKPPRS